MRTTPRFTVGLGALAAWLPAIVLVFSAAGIYSAALAQSTPPASPAAAPPAAAPATPAPAAAAESGTVEELFADFLHYARMGQFTRADAFAKALLEHPDMTPVKLLDASVKQRDSLRTLQTIIENSTISERAARVLELIGQGEFEKRQAPERIKANIEQLGGDPQQEFYAIKHLAESGEYAVPFMIATLLDDTKKNLHPRVASALPKIGKAALNPLVMALQLDPRYESVRITVIKALGEIGYPQAVPYLRRLMADPSTGETTRSAAEAAIARVEQISGRSYAGKADDQLFELADKYYNEDDSVKADPRLPRANVWYWNADVQSVQATIVQQPLFGPIMAMRCCEESVKLTNDRADALALWLAANIRREGRLGLNVESGDPEQKAAEPDPTKAENFPRALYFTQAAGPRYAHLVLERAVKDQDAPVALGAIEALRLTAGEVSLIGTEDFKQPLVEALQFPNLVVRVRAALALGAALPKSQFAGSQNVMPVLAGALGQTGKRQFLVVDADEANRNRVSGELRGDGEAIGEAGFFKGLNRARVEFTNLSAIYVASDIADPDLAAAVRALRGEFAYAKIPVVILVRGGQSVVADGIAKGDTYVETIDAVMDGAALRERFERIAGRTAQTPLDANLALSMALQSAETLRRIAVDGRTVHDFGLAEPALIGALSSSSEELQVKAASVLALATTETAQRSIAHLALDEKNTKTLRLAAFASLSESAKNNGNLVEDAQVAALVQIARDDEDLVIRTSASEALGALNLASNRASEIVRKHHRG